MRCRLATKVHLVGQLDIVHIICVDILPVKIILNLESLDISDRKSIHRCVVLQSIVIKSIGSIRCMHELPVVDAVKEFMVVVIHELLK